MINGIGDVSLNLAKQALDVASLRQQVIAHNIANASTPGFVPMRVSFENLLSGQRTENFHSGDKAVIEPEFSNSKSELTAVKLDMEVASMSQNTIYYQALLKGVAKKFALLSIAMNDGRR